MDNVQNCDSYINIPSSQTYRSYFLWEKSFRYPLDMKIDSQVLVWTLSKNKSLPLSRLGPRSSLLWSTEKSPHTKMWCRICIQYYSHTHCSLTCSCYCNCRHREKRRELGLQRHVFYFSPTSPILQPISVLMRSEAWTVFARYDAVVVGYTTTRGTDVCVSLFTLCCPVCR
jgi:hypothetical protein